MGCFHMVLKDDKIDQTFLLPLDIRTMIPSNHVCFFIRKLVDCMDFSDIDGEFKDNAGQKASPAAVLVRVIVLGMIYGVHSSRKLETIIRENIIFMYMAGFERPVFSTIASFKREHRDLIEDVFLETINYGHNKNLIDFESISVDGSKTRACANKYKNLTAEDIAKLLYIVEQGIILDEEENRLLEKRGQKTVEQEDMIKERIKKALRESRNLKLKEDKPNSKESKSKESKSKDNTRKRPMKEAMRTDASKYDDEMYELIDENNLNLCGKQILRQAIENPQTAYKQVKKLKKCKEMIEKTGDNTVNYTDPEARKSPNKEGIMQTGYNEQIVVDNKNGLIIAVDVTTDGNDQKQLVPMLEKTEENIQKVLNITHQEYKEQFKNIDLLADYGYFTYEGVDTIENKDGVTLYLPDKGLATKDKDKLRRPDQRKKKTRGYGKQNMTWNEENNCYICPEGQKLEQKQIYHLEDRDKVVYYGNNCKNCPMNDICLTNKMTTKVITDYVSDSTMKLKHRMHTTEGIKKYKDRMPNVEPRFAYNKETLKYRQYHVKGLENAKTEQLLMATAQNILKIHNIEQKENENQIEI